MTLFLSVGNHESIFCLYKGVQEKKKKMSPSFPEFSISEINQYVLYFIWLSSLAVSMLDFSHIQHVQSPLYDYTATSYPLT